MQRDQTESFAEMKIELIPRLRISHWKCLNMIFAPSLLCAACVYVLSRTSVGVVFNIVWTLSNETEAFTAKMQLQLLNTAKKYPSINPSKQVNLGYYKELQRWFLGLFVLFIFFEKSQCLPINWPLGPLSFWQSGRGWGELRISALYSIESCHLRD